MKSEVKSHYVRCNTECEMWGISISDACILFDSKVLWGHTFDILTDQVQEYFKREHMILQKNTYGIINEHLKHIWEMDEEVRKKTSIYSYILTRNHISRSAIHKIVREMTLAGDIIVNRGRLLGVLEILCHSSKILTKRNDTEFLTLPYRPLWCSVVSNQVLIIFLHMQQMDVNKKVQH